MKQLPILIVLAGLALPVINSAAFAEKAVTAEVSPPGDIPDNQAFVTYASPLGYAIKIPEGWARKDEGTKTTFSDKYNRVILQESVAGQPIDLAFAKSTLIPDVEKNGRAVNNVKAKTIAANSGQVVVVEYDANSEPNSVTNKQIREENESVYFVSGGKQVTLTLSAPKGADNVDQWNLMVGSFKWK